MSHASEALLSRQALTLDAGKDNVVTIFGFPNTEKSQAEVLQEFGKCGDILRFHRDTQCNWMHIQYTVGAFIANITYKRAHQFVLLLKHSCKGTS